MLKRFLPRQDQFFQLFQKSVDILVLTATQFHILLMDLKNQNKCVAAISEYEEEADKVAHTTFELLHKTFITPFDREDIYRLTTTLDDILDSINRCAQRFPIYNLENVPEDLIELSDLTVQCTKLLKKAIYRLHSLNKSQEILDFCKDLDELESRANKILLDGEHLLYQDEKDFKRFHKLQDIYERTKGMVDACQDLANIIKGIVLEYT